MIDNFKKPEETSLKTERGGVSEKDMIYRQAAIDVLNSVTHEHYITDFDAISTILDLPSAERKKGQWVQSKLDKDFLTCSNCKTEKLKMRMAFKRDYTNIFLYCPICGADMRGEE